MKTTLLLNSMLNTSVYLTQEKANRVESSILLPYMARVLDAEEYAAIVEVYRGGVTTTLDARAGLLGMSVDELERLNNSALCTLRWNISTDPAMTAFVAEVAPAYLVEHLLMVRAELGRTAQHLARASGVGVKERQDLDSARNEIKTLLLTAKTRRILQEKGIRTRHQALCVTLEEWSQYFNFEEKKANRVRKALAR